MTKFSSSWKKFLLTVSRSHPRVARVRILGVGLLGSVALLRDQVWTSQVLWLACRVDEILTKLEEDDTSAHTSLPQAQWADLSGDNELPVFHAESTRWERWLRESKTPKSRLLDAFCLPARVCLASARIISTRSDPHPETTDVRVFSRGKMKVEKKWKSRKSGTRTSHAMSCIQSFPMSCKIRITLIIHIS